MFIKIDKEYLNNENEFSQSKEYFSLYSDEIYYKSNEFYANGEIRNFNEHKRENGVNKRSKKVKFLLIPVVILYFSYLIFIDQDVIIDYVVRRGDTLWDISSMYLGSSTKYMQIVQENSIVNPHLIYPGQRFKITTKKRFLKENEESY